MPLYEYQCHRCETLFSERRPFEQAHETAACPACQSQETRKRIGAVAFVTRDGQATAAERIPVPMNNGGGCGCGSCSCGGH